MHLASKVCCAHTAQGALGFEISEVISCLEKSGQNGDCTVTIQKGPLRKHSTYLN